MVIVCGTYRSYECLVVSRNEQFRILYMSQRVDVSLVVYNA